MGPSPRRNRSRTLCSRTLRSRRASPARIDPKAEPPTGRVAGPRHTTSPCVTAHIRKLPARDELNYHLPVHLSNHPSIYSASSPKSHDLPVCHDPFVSQPSMLSVLKSCAVLDPHKGRQPKPAAVQTIRAIAAREARRLAGPLERLQRRLRLRLRVWVRVWVRV